LLVLIVVVHVPTPYTVTTAVAFALIAECLFVLASAAQLFAVSATDTNASGPNFNSLSICWQGEQGRGHADAEV